MSDDSPSLGGKEKPTVSNAPSLPYDRKQVQGLGKNQKLLMGWLYDQGRAVTWLEVLNWWADHLTKRYEKPIRPDIEMFNAMLSGLKGRKLITATQEIVNPNTGETRQGRCVLHGRSYYGDRVTIEAIKP